MKKIYKKVFCLSKLFFCIYLLCGCIPDDNQDKQRISPFLVSFNSCSKLEETLKNNIKQEMEERLLSWYDSDYRNWYLPVPVAEEDTRNGGGRNEGEDYSATNVQEEGVDEADFAKTDGYYIYVLNGEKLVISEILQPGHIKEVSSIDIEGFSAQMLLWKHEQGGRAEKIAVFSVVDQYSLKKDRPLLEHIIADGDFSWRPFTKITILDLETPEKPVAVKSFYLEGIYTTARQIESSVHIVSSSWKDINGLIYYPELPYSHESFSEEEMKEAIDRAIAFNNELIESLLLEDLLPEIFIVQSSGEVERLNTDSKGCRNFSIPEDGSGKHFTSIISLDLFDDNPVIDDQHILSNHVTVYASKDFLIIAEQAWDWWWHMKHSSFDEAVNIHRFKLSSGKSDYNGSGRVDGSIINQFAISEYNGYIRIATTINSLNLWWRGEVAEPENFVFVLAGDTNLEIVGKTEPIAKGESIWSVRFVEDRAYLVTFRNVDPFWTIDMSIPESPQVIGELKVPGVSTYIHPVNEDLLLAIGFGGDDEALDWSIAVSIFDVSDFANPEIRHTIRLVPTDDKEWENSWYYSEAVYEHKAFAYWKSKSLLAVPVTASRFRQGDDLDYYYEYISKLVLVSVDEHNGLSIYGEIDHSEFFNSETRCWWSYPDIRRSFFYKGEETDFIYAISSSAVSASRLDNLEMTEYVILPGTKSCY